MKLIQSLFSSKKFLAMLSGVVGLVILKLFKIEIDPTTVAEIVGLIAIYIGAQGVADHGVAAAKIQAVAASALSENLTPKAEKAVEAMAEEMKP